MWFASWNISHPWISPFISWNPHDFPEMFYTRREIWSFAFHIRDTWIFLKILAFITPILKSPMVPVIWLALIGAIYSQIAPFFALNRIFSPANEEATLKTKQPIRLQGLFKVTDHIAGRWKTWSIMWQILQLLFPKLLFFPPKKWMNLISNQLSIVLTSCALVQFWNHAYDFSPNYTPLSSITIINTTRKSKISTP